MCKIYENMQGLLEKTSSFFLSFFAKYDKFLWRDILREYAHKYRSKNVQKNLVCFADLAMFYERDIFGHSVL